MPVSIRSLAPGTRVNFVISAQVYNRTRFNAFSYQGEVSFVAASAVSTLDVRTLVDATKAYFREGSQKDADKITYLLVKESESSPLVVIPEPLLQLNTLEVAGNTEHHVTVRDSLTVQQLQEILTGNGLKDFSITTRQV